MSNEVAAPATRVTGRARGGWDDKQVELIRETVAKDCSKAELGMFLEVAARYELDPFAGQIYAAKIGSRDGGGGRVAIITSRDGFLAIANRHDDFRGLEGDVVRQNDSFIKRGDGSIDHEYEGGEDKRGNIVGAWARVYRERHVAPTYFFANWSEYSSTKPVWKSYPSAMILKVAEAMALRKAFNISGLLSEEESHSMAPDAPVDDGKIAYPGGALGDRIRMLVELANETVEGSYRPAKVRSMLASATDDDEGLATVASILADFIADNGGEVPVEAEVVTEEE